MKTLLILLLSCLSASAMDQIQALSSIESGDDDFAVGAAGEMSRYQVLPSEWISIEKEIGHKLNPTDQRDAKQVATMILDERSTEFRIQYHRPPTNFETYMLWHRPAILLVSGFRPIRSFEVDRAQRFANLCELR